MNFYSPINFKWISIIALVFCRVWKDAHTERTDFYSKILIVLGLLRSTLGDLPDCAKPSIKWLATYLILFFVQVRKTKRKFTKVDTEASVKYLELLPLSVSVTKKSPESILPPKRIKRELNDATSSPNVTVKTLKRRLVIKRGTKNDVNDDGRRFNHFERHYDDSDGSGDKSCFLIFFEICLVISRLGSKKTCRYSYFLSHKGLFKKDSAFQFLFLGFNNVLVENWIV